jgi:hypothetical protein
MRFCYHHAVELEFVAGPGPLRPARGADLLRPAAAASAEQPFAVEYELAYAWLAERAGFWPLFVAVGESDDDLRMTGYADQWRRAPPTHAQNQVLFSFEDLPDPLVFSDFGLWHIVLMNASAARFLGERTIEPVERVYERQMLRRPWSRGRWLRYAAQGYGVQACVPSLDLAAAGRVWCRNQATRRELLRRGFDAERVEARRLRVARLW